MPRTGRPPMPKHKLRTMVVPVRFTVKEHERLIAEAKRLGMTLSELLAKPWRIEE